MAKKPYNDLLILVIEATVLLDIFKTVHLCLQKYIVFGPSRYDIVLDRKFPKNELSIQSFPKGLVLEQFTLCIDCCLNK